jgi:REP element-mobilizing transposase RayT
LDIISAKRNKGVDKMPRANRIKNYDFIYHVMVRSISDTPLFKDNDDKDKYLFYIQKYQKKLGFKVYAYCLMTTHGHFIIDANGADISKVMHGINQCYAQYFNFRHKRHGHVFQDRFKSKVVDSEGYLFTLSAYIHNNPTDIEGYETCPELFKYSTLGMYLGLKSDEYGITDESFVMGFFSGNVKKAREEYYKFVMVCDDVNKKSHYDFKDEKSEYRSERTVLARNFKPEDVMEFITGYTGIDKKLLKWKYKRQAKDCRALCVFLVRYYCDFTYRDICSLIGGLTLTRISELNEIGSQLIQRDDRFKDIMKKFLKHKAA